MGAAEDFEEIKGLYKDANQLLGNIVKEHHHLKLLETLQSFCSRMD